jgi:hypothetical protein
MQCGTAVASDQRTPAEPLPKLNFIQPAVAGGMALGLLSSIPFISAGNYFCCMWVLGGGALAAYLLIQQRPNGITYGDGAFGGVLSGLFGSVVATIVSIPVRYLGRQMLESQKDAVEQAIKDVPGLEGPMRDLLMRMASPEISPFTLTVTFISNLLIFSLFAMIGGILMVAVLQRRTKTR